MKKLGLLFLFFMALAGTPLSAGHDAELVVEQDRITAGDLARILPAWKELDPATEVAYAPLPGIQRRVKASQILRWGRRFGLDLAPRDLPSALLVSRRMERLSAEQAADHLARGVARHYQVGRGQVRVRLHGFQKATIPAAAGELELAAPLNALNRRTTASLRWREPHGRTGLIPLQATVEILGSYAAAREALPPQTELTAADFDFQNGPLPGLPEKFLIHPQDVEGTQLKYPLKAGEALAAWMLRKQETVKRGDLIQLQLRAQGLVLRAPGRAEEAGSVGDRIACRNLDSGRRVRATVLEPKLAEVELVR